MTSRDLPHFGWDAVPGFEISSEVGRLLVSEIKRNRLDAGGFLEKHAGLFKANLAEPFRERNVVMLAEMALKSSYGDLAHLGETANAVIALGC